MSGFTATASASRRTAARALTEVFSPAHLAILLPPVVGADAGGLSGLLWGCVAATFTGVVPYAFLLLGVRRGRFGDRHVKERSQRFVPLLFGVVSVVVALVLLGTSSTAPRELFALVVAMLVGLAVTILVTTVWKISIHTGVAAGTVVILMLTFGPLACAAWLLVVATGWARVVLQDHTVAQVVAGAAVGAVVAGATFIALAP